MRGGRSVRTQHRRRGAALYITVMSTALLVSLLGLAGLTVMRIEHQQSQAETQVLAARCNARSAVELALARIDSDSNWRSTSTNGVESARVSLGPGHTGTLSFMFVDSDGSLNDPDRQLRLYGIGRADNAVQVCSIALATNTQGPIVVRSETSFSDLRVGEVDSNDWWCQYLKATLPANALGWKVTAVDLYCQRDHSSRSVDFRLYEPLAHNMPSDTVIDSVVRDSSSFSSLIGWQRITFAGESWLAPEDGICLAVQSTASQAPLRLYYRDDVHASHSALIKGKPVWNEYDSDEALLYRLYGVYQTSDGQMRPIAGSWRSEAAP